MGQAGLIKATVGSITAEARARVIPPLPWNETFDSYPVGSVPLNWVSATTVGKFQVTELDGQKVLEKCLWTLCSSACASSWDRPTGPTTQWKPLFGSLRRSARSATPASSRSVTRYSHSATISGWK